MLKNYTIPVVDISQDTFRQTVVDREKGLYIGHPTTALLDDQKTIVIVYPKNHGNGQIVLKKSFDAGITWSGRLPVPPSWTTSLETPTLYKTYDMSGARHLIMFSSLYPIRMAHSEDDGDTWTELEPIGDYGGIVAMGDMLRLGQAEYVAFFHDDGRFFHPQKPYRRTTVFATGQGEDRRSRVLYETTGDNGKTWGNKVENWVKTIEKDGDKWEQVYQAFSEPGNGGHFTLYQVRSMDGGLTWGTPEPICAPKDVCLCEPGIARSPDATEVCMLLRENSRKANSHVIFSRDNCKTWSGPQELQGALTGDRHCVRYLKDGRLFITFRDTCLDSPTKGDWCAWIGNYSDIQNGGEGQYRIRIMKNFNSWDCAYPGAEILPDGTVVTTTYGHWTEGEPPYIVSVRFHPNELDRKFAAHRKAFLT